MRQIQQDVLSALAALQPAPQSLLDAGCGNGYFTRIMASALPNTRISAVDPKVPKPSVDSSRLAFYRSSIEALPFETESFDAVVACMSFHHWEDKQRGIREAYRVLKPQGSLIIGDPFFEGVMANRFMAWFIQKTDGGKFTAFDDLNSYLTEAGFEPMAASPVQNSFGTMFVVSARKPHALNEG